ncbi:MAG: PilZ domain-containing protein [Candidatus Omnitrophica bacterium]|nr:PilZ domain-containing protein [Candidatus Omnitrophota bacterium]
MGDLAEKRKNSRYVAEVAMRYDFMYDVTTKLQFQVKGQQENSPVKTLKYPAISKNISIEGLGFVASKKLTQGDILNLELYLPHEKKPIRMEGLVRWSRPIEITNRPISKLRFETGVQLSTIEGHPVENSVYFDKTYNVLWSEVLESVLGGYRLLAQGKKKKTS